MPVEQASRLGVEEIKGLATLTPKQVCRILDMDEDSVLKALRLGELPGFRVGRLWRIPTAKLLAMLDSEPGRTRAA